MAAAAAICVLPLSTISSSGQAAALPSDAVRALGQRSVVELRRRSRPVAAHGDTGGGCQLSNGVKQVFYIGFDNFHLRRDNSNSVANDGDENNNTDTSTSSDLEKLPRSLQLPEGHERCWDGNG